MKPRKTEKLISNSKFVQVDVYSMGIVAFHLFNNKFPFNTEKYRQLWADNRDVNSNFARNFQEVLSTFDRSELHGPESARELVEKVCSMTPILKLNK